MDPGQRNHTAEKSFQPGVAAAIPDGSRQQALSYAFYQCGILTNCLSLV